jgi:hypothetical protein
VPSESLDILYAISFFKTCFLRWPTVHKEQPRISKSNSATLIGMSLSAVPFADRGFRLGQTRRNIKRCGSPLVGLQYGRLSQAPPCHRLSCEGHKQKRGAESSELRATFAFHTAPFPADVTDNDFFRCRGQVGLKLYVLLRNTMWYFHGHSSIFPTQSYELACSGTTSFNKPVSNADRTLAIVFSSIAV